MLARDLYQLLEAPDGVAIRDAIAPAMPAYRRGLAEHGRKAPVAVRGDGALLVIAASHLAALCEAFLAQDLDATELSYVATALDLAPDFRFISGTVEECAFLLSSSIENDRLTPESVSAVLRVLREHAA